MKFFFLPLVLFIILLSSCKKDDEKIHIETSSASYITSTSASINGKLIERGKDPISELGFIWSNSPGLNIDKGTKKSINIPSTSSNFFFYLEDLSPSTQYYFKAYSITGSVVHYGEEKSFQTKTPGQITLTPQEALTGEIITINGENFTTDLKKLVVKFDTTTAEILEATTNSIKVKVPKYLQDDNAIIHVTFGGKTFSSDKEFQLNYWKTLGKIPYKINEQYANTLIIGQRIFLISTSKMFEFDFVNNSWIERKQPPIKHNLGVVFSIGNKGYMGVGQNLRSEENRDFYEYDPEIDQWTKKSDFPGLPRIGALGFSINNKGYIGLGKSIVNEEENYYKDFWIYDPINDNWNKLNDFPGGERAGAIILQNNQNIYLGLGSNILTNLNDFWSYNDEQDKWYEKAPLPSIGRASSMTFVLNNNGYIIGGGTPSYLNDVWKYDFDKNQWKSFPNYSGSSRTAGFSFVSKNKGYIGLGAAEVYKEIEYLKEFTPNE